MRRLFDCFQEFSKVSMFIAKSNIYFGGVIKADQQAILQYTDFKKGTLPFKYLGVPLSSKKAIYKPMLTIDRQDVRKYLKLDCQIPIICWQITTCPKCVVSNLKFLVTNFLFTNENAEEVETVCKRFLRNGEVQNKDKALTVWEIICQPKSIGGLKCIHRIKKLYSNTCGTLLIRKTNFEFTLLSKGQIVIEGEH